MRGISARPLSPVLGGGALGNLATVLIGRRGRSSNAGARRGHWRRYSQVLGGGALCNLVAILIERRGRGSYAGARRGHWRRYSQVLGGGALGNLATVLIGRRGRGSYVGDLGAAIVAGTGRRCLRQLSDRTHRAARARQLCGDLGAATVGGALGNLVAILIERRGRGSYVGDLGAAIVAGTGRRCLI